MSILSWLKRLTRRRLDEEDFEDEIRAHLAIAADERMADGADRQTAHYAALKEFGNVTLTTEAARRVWTPWWLDALHDLVERRPLRAPGAREEPGLLAHRRRRAHARHRPERRRLHACSRASRSPRSPGLTGRRDSPSSSARRARDVRSRLVSRLPAHPRPRSRVLGALRLRLGDSQPGQGPKRPPDLGRARHRELLPGPRRACPARPHAPALGRDRSRPPSGRRAQRWPVAARLRRRSGHRRQDARDQQPRC